MAAQRRRNRFYDALKSTSHIFDPDRIVEEFDCVSEERVDELAARLAEYITNNLPSAFERRNGLPDYRTNPYVLMTTASVMGLDDPAAFGYFLFNSKMYMALETSFGKSIEAAFVSEYPLDQPEKWTDAPEKITEFARLADLSREERARQRTASVWREIDKSCVVDDRRYITSIKSGPNTINDTQVQAMYSAIAANYEQWFAATRESYPQVTTLDIVLGLTYGTDRTTNNKENQILVKLLESGFVEEDRETAPGVLIDERHRAVRVYRRIGKDFWAFVGKPHAPETASFVYLEILLALAKALHSGIKHTDLEERINIKIGQLCHALRQLQFPRKSLPHWIREDFSDDQLFWFATAMSGFFDEGI